MGSVRHYNGASYVQRREALYSEQVITIDGVQSDCINALNGSLCPYYVKYFPSAFTVI